MLNFEFDLCIGRKLRNREQSEIKFGSRFGNLKTATSDDMPYNFRPRAPDNLRLPPLAPFKRSRRAQTVKHDLQDPTPDPSLPNSGIPHLRSSVVVEHKQPDVGVNATSPTYITNADYWSPVLVAASSSNPLTELPDKVSEFLDPIEIGRGRSGIVYRVNLSSGDCNQLVAIKMIDGLEEFEQEIKTYSHLISRGIQGKIPDVYGYRRWTRSRWKKEFPTLDSWDMPHAGGIFMEYLGPDLTPVYDAGMPVDPSYIAEYLDIMWMLRKTHVYHKDFGLNLFVTGPKKRLVLLDFAYSTISLTSSALETEWKDSTEGILKSVYASELVFVDVQVRKNSIWGPRFSRLCEFKNPVFDLPCLEYPPCDQIRNPPSQSEALEYTQLAIQWELLEQTFVPGCRVAFTLSS